MVWVMRPVPIASTLRRASPRKRLWVGGLALAAFLLTLLIGNRFVAADRAVTRVHLGHDFLAFYTAAAFVRDGHAAQLYDLDAVRRAEQATARANGVDLGTAFGPWWNPPFYALALEPLAGLSYGRALDRWRWINVAAAAAAAGLLGRMVARPHPLSNGPERRAFIRRSRKRARPCGPSLEPLPPPRSVGFSRSGRPGRALVDARRVPLRGDRYAVVGTALNGAENTALVALLLATSMPFVQALSHGQNTFTSLLVLTATVALWRADRGFAAGVVGGLLFYKPQLAAVVASVMAVDLGPPAVAGLAVTGLALLLTTRLGLPGSLTDWVHQLPANVRYMQVEHAYLWDRHVTLKAFWRLLLQGTAAGEMTPLATALTGVSLAAVAVPLAWAAVRARGRADRRDRLITATVCAMPLLMPFYFDYDLLLLAVPAALYAADARRDPRLTAAWVGLYGWLFVNAAIASRLHVGGAALLLAGVTGLSIRRVNRPEVAATPTARPAAFPLANAA